MIDKTEIEDRWDFYVCRVEDHPGSMSLNMAYHQHAPIRSLDTLYWIDFTIIIPGDHGMGVAEEADKLNKIEDLMDQALWPTPLFFVGRLRNHGLWTLYFYGPPSQEDLLCKITAETIGSNSQQKFSVGSKNDPRWSCYLDFIYPSTERYRWMLDRSVVDQCAKHGDLHDRPRRIDHWVYFEYAADRDRFIELVRPDGFDAVETETDETKPSPYGAQVFRDDPSELNHIHGVIMWLIEQADACQGNYDGWETFIVNDDQPAESK